MARTAFLSLIVAAFAVVTACNGRPASCEDHPKASIAPAAKSVTVKGIVWLGIRTSAFDASVRFYEGTLGLKPIASDPDFRAYDLPNGDRVELFSEREADHLHFTTGPVAGFLVDSVGQARIAMEKRGIHFTGPIHRSPTDEWSHFNGPDGNVYEITSHRSQ